MSVRVGGLKVCITSFIQYSGLSQKVDKRIINMTHKLVGEDILNIKETQRALRKIVKKVILKIRFTSVHMVTRQNLQITNGDHFTMNMVPTFLG